VLTSWPKLGSYVLKHGQQNDTTSLKAKVREEGLAIHPDRVYTDYITDGITQGFRTRFHYTCQLGEAKHNNYVVSRAESSGSG